jgi:hypothetical protein
LRFFIARLLQHQKSIDQRGMVMPPVRSTVIRANCMPEIRKANSLFSKAILIVTHWSPLEVEGFFPFFPLPYTFRMKNFPFPKTCSQELRQ